MTDEPSSLPQNLDVLFKRDYYAQRADGSVMVMTGTSDGGCSSSSGKFSNGEDEEEEEVDDEKDEEAEPLGDEGREKTGDGDDDHNNNNNNNEERAINGEVASEVAEVASGEEKAKTPSFGSKGFSPNAPPFVPSQQAQPPPPPLPPTSVAPTSRPNLFLYSPASNTMIPCEEIIIPNPVMGPEVGNHLNDLSDDNNMRAMCQYIIFEPSQSETV